MSFLRVIRKKRNDAKRRNSPAQMFDFALLGASFYDGAHDVINHKWNSPVSQSLSQGEIYPLFYDSNPGALELLRLLIKEIRPAIVVETGVANGASTRTILSSFKEFDLIDSNLFSLDVDPRVATPDLVSSPQFNFVLVESPDTFLSAMKEIKVVDLFYHDSDHSYDNQMLEYNNIWEILNPVKGVLVSDDINWSNAFLDFCKKVNRVPIILSDGWKFLGVIYK